MNGWSRTFRARAWQAGRSLEEVLRQLLTRRGIGVGS